MHQLLSHDRMVATLSSSLSSPRFPSLPSAPYHPLQLPPLLMAPYFSFRPSCLHRFASCLMSPLLPSRVLFASLAGAAHHLLFPRELVDGMHVNRRHRPGEARHHAAERRHQRVAWDARAAGRLASISLPTHNACRRTRTQTPSTRPTTCSVSLCPLRWWH